jgi:hypothetical protein
VGAWPERPVGQPGGAEPHRLEILAPEIAVERRVVVVARVARQVMTVGAALQLPVLELVVGCQAAAHLGLTVDHQDVVGAFLAGRHHVARVPDPAVQHRAPLAVPVLEPRGADLLAAVLAQGRRLAASRRHRQVAKAERPGRGGPHRKARRDRHPAGRRCLGGRQGGPGHPRQHAARPDRVARVDLHHAARPADPVDRRGRRRRHPDLDDVGDRDRGQVEVAIVRVAHRDAVDEDLHGALAGAPDLHLLAAASLFAHHQIGQELERLGQVGGAARCQLLTGEPELGVAVEWLVRPLAPDLDRLAGDRRIQEDGVLGCHRRSCRLGEGLS